jgi:hypothetical protein
MVLTLIVFAIARCDVAAVGKPGFAEHCRQVTTMIMQKKYQRGRKNV